LPFAFLFDLDGVIVDSMPLHTIVWQEYLDSHGIDSTDLPARMHGARNDALVRVLFGAHLDEGEVQAHGAAKEALFRARLAPELEQRLVPGIGEFLTRHQARPKAVGSNAEMANIAQVLDGAGLRGHFRAIVDGDQVAHPKPQPDIYLRAASLLGVAPAHCIVFEDSPTGVAAGRAAGMRVVGINTARLAALPGVDLLVDNFHSAELASWLSIQLPPTH
jgi:beta-phosphoglucomutase